MAYLVLVRHGQSEWNALGKWTGWANPDLTDKGRSEAKTAAKTLEDITFHSAHSAKLQRARHTLDEILNHLDQATLDVKESESLNERDYGDLTGKNKWEVRDEHGEEQFLKWRRGWDEPIPNGETLKDVHGRVVPYYEEAILADLKAGKNVIVASSGNALRALVKHLESVAEPEVSGLEIGTGEVYLYEIEPENGRIIAKEIRVTGGKA